MQALSTAATGLSAQQQRIDMIAGNLANINTTAYKSAASGFFDTYYTAMENPDPAAAAANRQRGTGLRLSSTAVDFRRVPSKAPGMRWTLPSRGTPFSV